MSAILLKQIFSSDLAKILFPSNAFYAPSKDDSAFVNSDKVNLPQSGDAPGVVKNRSSYPASATQRTDSATQYDLEEFTSNPTHLQHSEELVVNYAKRASIVEDHGKAINDAIAESIMYNWARGGDSENSWTKKPEMVRTSGTAVRDAFVKQIGATAVSGTRKRIVKADLQKVNTILNRQNVPMSGRFGLITADMLEDFFLIEEFANSDYNKAKPYAEGQPETFTFMGVTWYVRSDANVFTNVATPVLKAKDANTAATDNNGALIWHRDFVRKAKGGVKFFLDQDDPQMYGDVMSSLVRAGSIGARKDGKGIVNLVEAAGS